MKKIFLTLVFSIFSLFVFSQEQDIPNTKTSDIKKVETSQENSTQNFDDEQNDYILIPTLGFSRLGVGAGLDFMYRKENGFSMFVNLNLAVPLPPMASLGGFIATTEVYFGYAIKKGGFYAVFSGGSWMGGGIIIEGYATHGSKEFLMHGPLNAWNSIMFALAFRNDFMYFFNSKVGINFSHTHAVGAHIASWKNDLMAINYNGQRLIVPYYFMLKLGVAIKI